MKDRYSSLREFYPAYLDEHQNRLCRRLHFIGSGLVLLSILAALLLANPYFLLATPVIGYGFAWFGHFYYEKNRPATFKYPLYSFLCDWLMFRDILLGRIKA